MEGKPLILEELETCFSGDRAPPSTPLSLPLTGLLSHLSSPKQGPLSSDLAAGTLSGSPSLLPHHAFSFLLGTHPPPLQQGAISHSCTSPGRARNGEQGRTCLWFLSVRGPRGLN